MELEEVILKRHSVRKFKADEPDGKVLYKVIELAVKCPSAGGIRGYEIVVTEKKVGPYDAPIYLVICVNQDAYVPRYGDRGYSLYAIQDSAIFTAYVQLLLVDAGLASCWVGAFNEGRVKRAVGTELRPVAMLAVGYEA